MITLGVNQNNDIFARNGRLVLAYGIDACMQSCARAVKAQVSEMPFAFDKGVDYKNFIFNGSPRWNSFISACKAQILSVKGVISIQSLQLAFKDGLIAYEAIIQTEFGNAALGNFYDKKASTYNPELDFDIIRLESAVELFVLSSIYYTEI